MKVKLDENVFMVDFAFSKETPRVTACVITDENKGDETKGSVGLAVCSKKDNFNKATGKKLALLRAMKQYGFSKDERKLVWEQYFQQNKMV